jgi:mannosyltransferase OCH1-like enzyme
MQYKNTFCASAPREKFLKANFQKHNAGDNYKVGQGIIYALIGPITLIRVTRISKNLSNAEGQWAGVG